MANNSEVIQFSLSLRVLSVIMCVSVSATYNN